MKKTILQSIALLSLLSVSSVYASGPFITDHKVGTPVVQNKALAAGMFGTDVAVDNNSDYCIVATIEGVQVIIDAHRGKNFHFTDNYRVLRANIAYHNSPYHWSTDLLTPESTALEVSASSIINGNPYFRVDPIFE